MSCPLPVLQWSHDNRVRLLRGKVNRWVLAYSLPTEMGRASLEERAREAMAKWFSASALDTRLGDAGQAVDAIRVERISFERPVPEPSEQRREQLTVPPTLAPSRYGTAFFTVTFNYRGQPDSLGWPVWTGAFRALGDEDSWCPVRCTWMLEQAASSGPEAPPELSLLDKLQAYGGSSPATPSALSSVARSLQYAGYVALGVAAYKTAELALAFVPRRRGQS